MGFTLSGIATAAGMKGNALRHALDVPRADAERVIAAALDVHPMEIWPSRYDADGARKRPQPRANYLASPRFRNPHNSHGRALSQVGAIR